MRWTFLVLAACAHRDAVPVDAGSDGVTLDAPDTLGPDAPIDADPFVCAVSGAPGECIATTSCSALGDHTSYAGHCAGPADIQCCIRTPNVADNPPIPTGYKLMPQADVTSDMTTWAVDILHDPVTYPMFATAMRTFGTLAVLARVEWHSPDFQNSVVHRGVTLYEPI